MIFKYEPEMIDAAEKIFPYVKEQLAKVAYFHSNSILIEGFNELFVMMYFKENSLIDQYNVANNEWRGFIWMSRAVRFMENFSINRNLYPFIEDFMPQLIAFISFCGENIEQIVDEFKHKIPYVVNVFPDLNTTVPADIKEIRIDFSHQMSNVFGWIPSKHTEAILPQIDDKACYWSKDEKTFIMPVTLEKSKTYALLLGVFQSLECYSMNKDFEIVFKTAE
jgi:hypothetical protein